MANFTSRFNDVLENLAGLGVYAWYVLYESTAANVTLDPYARARPAGRMVACLKLFAEFAGFE
jgi:hypothetical protein